MKKLTSLVLALLMLVSACSVVLAEDMEITYNCLWAPEFVSPPQLARAALLKDYLVDHPNVKVIDNSVSDQDHQVKLNQWIAAKDVPDLFMVQLNHAKLLKENDLIYTGDDLFAMVPGWKEQFVAESFTDLTDEQGNILAVPYQYQAVNILYCNQELFDKAGAKIPTTVDEFFEACEKLKAAGITPFGFGNRGTGLLGDVFWNGIVVGFTGSEWYDGILKARGDGSNQQWADNPAFMDALRFMEKMGKEQYVNQDTNALEENDAYILFLQEKCAMTSFGGWFGEWLETQDRDFCNKVVMTYPPTNGATPANTLVCGASWGWAVRKDISEDKLKNIVELLYDYTAEPYTKAALEQGFVRVPCAVPADADMANVPVLSQQTMKLTADAVKVFDSWGGRMAQDLQTTFGECFQDLFVGNCTAEEACERIQYTYDDIY